MSNTTNSDLMERAQEQLEYWTGTMWERLIQRDLTQNDLESLRYHLRQAEAEQSLQESL